MTPPFRTITNSTIILIIIIHLIQIPLDQTLVLLEPITLKEIFV